MVAVAKAILIGPMALHNVLVAKVAMAAPPCNNFNLMAKVALLFNNLHFLLAKVAIPCNNLMLLVAKVAMLPMLTQVTCLPAVAISFSHNIQIFPKLQAAILVNNNNLLAKAASLFNNLNLLVAKVGTLFNNLNLLVPKAATLTFSSILLRMAKVATITKAPMALLCSSNGVLHADLEIKSTTNGAICAPLLLYFCSKNVIQWQQSWWLSSR